MVLKGRMLAIEVATRTIRAVEFVPGSDPIEVIRVATMERPSGEPALVAKILKELLAENGFTAKRALVAYSGSLIEHRIYIVPPVSGETLDELLRGKIAQEVSTPIAELRVSGEIVGKTSERGLERAEALAVYTPDFEVRRLTYLLVEAGISPARIASIPLALAALHPKDQEDALVGYVHVEAGRCTFTVSSDAKLRFAREFTLEHPHPKESDDSAAAAESGRAEFEKTQPTPALSASEAAERLVSELTRSLLYLRQVSHGGAISKLYWSGEAPSAEAQTLVDQRLKLAITSHPAETVAVFSAADWMSASEYAVPLGLAKAGQIPEQVNLLPEGYQRRRTRRRYLAAIVAVWAIFLLAAGSLFAGLQDAQNRYREVIGQSEALTAERAGAQDDFLRWIARRKQAEDAKQQDRRMQTSFTRWKALLAWLGSSMPREMTFTVLTIDRTTTGYQGELRGLVRGRDPSEIQSRLNGFLGAIQTRSLGQGVLYTPIEVRPVREDGSRGVLQEFRLVFKLVPEA